MKMLVTMTIAALFLAVTLTAMPVAADQRRHYGAYENDRNHQVSSYRRDHDPGRYGKHWPRDHHEVRYWKKQRRHRHGLFRPAPKAVYKPFMGPIVYPEPVLLLPPRSLTVGAPHLRFRIAW